jgi:hypothetical protein
VSEVTRMSGGGGRGEEVGVALARRVEVREALEGFVFFFRRSDDTRTEVNVDESARGRSAAVRSPPSFSFSSLLLNRLLFPLSLHIVHCFSPLRAPPAFSRAAGENPRCVESEERQDHSDEGKEDEVGEDRREAEQPVREETGDASRKRGGGEFVAQGREVGDLEGRIALGGGGDLLTLKKGGGRGEGGVRPAAVATANDLSGRLMVAISVGREAERLVSERRVELNRRRRNPSGAEDELDDASLALLDVEGRGGNPGGTDRAGAALRTGLVETERLFFLLLLLLLTDAESKHPPHLGTPRLDELRRLRSLLLLRVITVVVPLLLNQSWATNFSGPGRPGKGVDGDSWKPEEREKSRLGRPGKTAGGEDVR